MLARVQVTPVPVLDVPTERAVPLQVHATPILAQAMSTALSDCHSHTGHVRDSAGHTYYTWL